MIRGGGGGGEGEIKYIQVHSVCDTNRCTQAMYLFIAVNAIVDMETQVRKCTRKPLRRQVARPNTSLPDTTVLTNIVPGIQAFKRSVTAKAAMYTFVEIRRRGFR